MKNKTIKLLSQILLFYLISIFLFISSPLEIQWLRSFIGVCLVSIPFINSAIILDTLSNTKIIIHPIFLPFYEILFFCTLTDLSTKNISFTNCSKEFHTYSGEMLFKIWFEQVDLWLFSSLNYDRKQRSSFQETSSPFSIIQSQTVKVSFENFIIIIIIIVVNNSQLLDTKKNETN